VLADLGLRALVFVITDYVGMENTWDVQYGWRRFRHLSWEQLGHWQERGIEVHAHGATHARLTWLSDAQVTEELERSREAIRSRLGTAPSGVGYPFGAADERVCALAVRAGFGLGFAGPSAPASDPMLLPRLPVYQWDRAGVPFVLHPGGLGPLARGVARLTNRIAVGTAVFQRALGRRYR
jgi:peptidoglycan/xylan/chitin deacetylase (PgdA/CDA1 family)